MERESLIGLELSGGKNQPYPEVLLIYGKLQRLNMSLVVNNLKMVILIDVGFRLSILKLY